jgi:hypothetical protein
MSDVTIPESVVAAAREAASAYYDSITPTASQDIRAGNRDKAPVVQIAISAILTERWRAAQIVALYGDHPDAGVAFVSDEIAQAIRSSHE